MFTITKDPNEDPDEKDAQAVCQATFEPDGSVRLRFSKNWISVEIKVSGKNVPLSKSFSPNVTLVSEWLTLEIDALPKNDLNQIGQLTIEEVDGEVSMTGAYSKAFSTGDDMGFYYYVDQSLFPDRSHTVLKSLGSNKFHFKHESVVGSYTFNVDTELSLTEVSATAYHDETDAKGEIEKLKTFFAKHFDASKFQDPAVHDTGTCLMLSYKT